MPVDLTRLPSVLSLPLQAYLNESNANLKLYRLCEAAEIVTRFSAIAALAELRTQLGDQPLPQSLADWLQKHIERPTWGQWCELLRQSIASPNRTCPLVAPEILAFVNDGLNPLIGEDPDSRESSVVQLRNDLFHGGAITRAAAQILLSQWEPRFLAMVDELGRLTSVELCFLDGGQAYRLVGPIADRGPAIDLSGAMSDSLNGRDGHVLLVFGDRWLDLWPLCDYGRADAKADESSPLIFARAERDRLFYAALGVDWPHGERTDIVQQFRELFRLEERRTAKAVRAPDFESEIRADAQALIGRVADLRHAKEIIKNTQSGVLWIGGPAGIGKSFLMAKLASNLAGDSSACRIAWRFRAGDGDRCTRSAFLRHAIEKLAKWLDKKGLEPAADPSELLGQLRQLLDESSRSQSGQSSRIIFVLDGMDEIDRVDLSFAQLPFMLAKPGVVWLCAGRPERNLPQTFAADRCTHVFPDGLPSMSDADVRGMLLDGAGNLKFDLLRLDKEKSDATVTNAAVEAVVKRADGLPLYVHYAVQDILAGHFRIDELHRKLPPSLNDYYDDLLRRLGIGELPALVTQLVVTLAWAHAPLDEATLHLLMVRRGVATDDEAGRLLLRRGLTAVRGMIRPAATPTGRDGFEPYHFSFREHVRNDPKGEIGAQNQLTRDALCDFVRDWASLPTDHPARDYALRFGPRTLLEAERWDDLEAMLTDLAFLEAKLGFGLSVGLSEDLSICELACPPTHRLNGVLNVFRLALRGRWPHVSAHPSALAQCIWNNGNLSLELAHSRDEVGELRPTRTEGNWDETEEKRANASQIVIGWLAGKRSFDANFVWLRALTNSNQFSELKPAATVQIGSERITGLMEYTMDRLAEQRMLFWRRNLANQTCLAFSPDDKTLYTGFADGTVSVAEVDSGVVLKRTTLAHRPVDESALSKWRIEKHESSWRADLKYVRENSSVHCLTCCCKGDYLATGSPDGVIRRWHPATLELLSEDDLRELLSTKRETRADSSEGQLASPNSRDERPLCYPQSISAFSESMWVTANASGGDALCILSIATGENPFWLQTTGVISACSPDSGLIAFVTRSRAPFDDGERETTEGDEAEEAEEDEEDEDHPHLVVFDLQTSPYACRLRIPLLDEQMFAETNAVVFSNDGLRLATAGQDCVVRVYDLAHAEHVQKLVGHVDNVVCLVFSPDGKELVSGSADRTARVWDVESGQTIGILSAHEGTVNAVSWSPLGTMIATAGTDARANVWHVSELIASRNAHSAPVEHCVCAPDSTHVLSACRAGTICAWDTRTGVLLARNECHSTLVVGVCYLRCREWALSYDRDGLVQLMHNYQTRKTAMLSELAVPKIGVKERQLKFFERLVPGHVERAETRMKNLWIDDARKCIHFDVGERTYRWPLLGDAEPELESSGGKGGLNFRGYVEPFLIGLILAIVYRLIGWWAILVWIAYFLWLMWPHKAANALRAVFRFARGALAVDTGASSTAYSVVVGEMETRLVSPTTKQVVAVFDAELRDAQVLPNGVLVGSHGNRVHILKIMDHKSEQFG